MMGETINTIEDKYYENSAIMLRISGTPTIMLATEGLGSEPLTQKINSVTQAFKDNLEIARYRMLGVRETKFTNRLAEGFTNLQKAIKVENGYKHLQYGDKLTTDNKTMKEIKESHALSLNQVEELVYDNDDFYMTKDYYEDMVHNELYMLLIDDGDYAKFKIGIDNFTEDMETLGFKVEPVSNPTSSYKEMLLGIYNTGAIDRNPTYTTKKEHVILNYETFDKHNDEWTPITEYMKVLHIGTIGNKRESRLYLNWLDNLMMSSSSARLIIEAQQMGDTLLEREYIPTIQSFWERMYGNDTDDLTKKELKQRKILAKREEWSQGDGASSHGKIADMMSNLTDPRNTIAETSMWIVINASSVKELAKQQRRIIKQLNDNYGMDVFISKNQPHIEQFEKLLQTSQPLDKTIDLPLNYLISGYPFSSPVFNESDGDIIGKSIITDMPVIINNGSFKAETDVNKPLDRARELRQEYDISEITKDYTHKNGNAIVLAQIGHGKSTLLGQMVLNGLIKGKETIILDPSGEYVSRAIETGGTVYDFSTTTTVVGDITLPKSGLNPFEIFNINDKWTPLDKEHKKQKISNKINMLTSFLQVLEPHFSTEEGLIEMDIMLNGVKLDYEKNFEAYAKGVKQWPTFDTQKTIIQATISDYYVKSVYVLDELDSIRAATQKYKASAPITYNLLFNVLSEGTLEHSLFSKVSQITESSEQNLIVLNTKGHNLNSSNDSVTSTNALYMLLISWVDDRILSGRYNKEYLDGSKNNLVFVLDEAHVYLRAKDPKFRIFLEKLYKQARKRNVEIILATQDMSDILAPDGTSVFTNNSESVYIGAINTDIGKTLDIVQAEGSLKAPLRIIDTYKTEVQNSTENSSNRGNFLVIRGGKYDIFRTHSPYYADTFVRLNMKMKDKYQHLTNFSISGKGKNEDRSQAYRYSVFTELLRNFIKQYKILDVNTAELEQDIIDNVLTYQEIKEKYIPTSYLDKFEIGFRESIKSAKNNEYTRVVVESAAKQLVSEISKNHKDLYYNDKIMV